MRTFFSVLVIGAATAACTTKPAPAPAPAPAEPPAGRAQLPSAQQEPAGGDSAGGGRAGAAPARPRPYNRVITREAQTRRGLFLVHRVNDRLYFEIPSRELGKDQLLVGRFTRAAAVDPNPTPGGGGGFPSYVGDQFADLRVIVGGNRGNLGLLGAACNWARHLTNCR